MKQNKVKIFSLLFNRKWLLSTILAMLAIIVMVRLGVWQLDRLETRRRFNQHYLQQIASPPIELDPDNLPLNLEEMEYREVLLSGEYDHQFDMAIRNQSWEGQLGVHLLTPLRLQGSDLSVLVDRGWIPQDQYQTGDWSDFEVKNSLQLSGIIRLSQANPKFGGRPDPTPVEGEISRAWNFVNVPNISNQLPYPILPFYVQVSPSQGNSSLPFPSQPEIEVTEGSHLSYAIQWFSFSLILLIGYPVFLSKQPES